MKSEDKIQQEIVIWFRNNNLGSENIIFSVPNSGKNIVEQLRKKATGLLPGASDLICLYNKKIYFVEVKDDKGKQSDNQKTFETIIKNNGFKYILVRSLDEFKKQMT